MGRRETKMQGRAMDVYRPGEVTQADAAKQLKLSRAALAMRLHRYRKRNGIRRRPARPKHRHVVNVVSLSSMTNI